MFSLASKLWDWGKKGGKAVATGNAQAQLGLQSPYLATAMVRVGRFLYVVSAGWITAAWYTGYVNMRTQPGSGPTLLIPGTTPPVPGQGVNRSLPKAGWAQQGLNSGGGSTVTTNSGTSKGGSNPFPGATGSRLDQGFDLTTKVFKAPDKSQIVFASPRVPGWNNGGMVCGKLLAGPHKGMVWYYAEGLRPTVKVGQVVAAGQSVATPVANPYNGIVGNMEGGWANPSSPTQPLAQVSSNKPAVAWSWYNYVRSLGGPKATSTGNAGYP